jgi:hypothetical protein
MNSHLLARPPQLMPSLAGALQVDPSPPKPQETIALSGQVGPSNGISLVLNYYDQFIPWAPGGRAAGEHAGGRGSNCLFDKKAGLQIPCHNNER